MTETIIEGTATEVQYGTGPGSPSQPYGMMPAQPQQAVAVHDQHQSDPLRYLGLMDPAQFQAEMDAIRAGTDRIAAIYRNLLRPEIDYGVIPGTKTPSLLQPGAERLAMIARLVPRHEQRIVTTPVQGHPERIDVFDQCFLHFESLEGPVKGSAVASCSSYEERYRWRNKERSCPQCGNETIIKGNPQYAPRTHGREGPVMPGYEAGGWNCWKKKGGCGANYTDNDLRITGQTPGKVENEEMAALINTLVQIAAKRGFVGAVRHTLGITDLFTQDVEDMPAAILDSPPPASPPSTQARPVPAAAAPVAAAASGHLTFEGPVMATPDGIRSTGKGRVLAFAIKVGNSKHNVELWDDLADSAFRHITEGAVLRVDGVRIEEDWPGRGDKPRKKVIEQVSRVVRADTGEIIAERAPGASQTPGNAPEADPGPGLFDDDLMGEPERAAPVALTGKGDVDATGTIRTIRWEVTPKGKAFAYVEILDPETPSYYFPVAVKEEDAFATIADEGSRQFSVEVGGQLRIMGGWNEAGRMVIAGIVMPVAA